MERLLLVTAALLFCDIASSITISRTGNDDKVSYCAFDGYENPADKEKCLCQSEYLHGDHCEDFLCLNKGELQTGNSLRCKCPTGFLGPHCEPVKCIAPIPPKNLDAVGDEEALTIIWTANEALYNVVNGGDDIPTAILDLVGNLSIQGKKVKTLFVEFLGVWDGYDLVPPFILTCDNPANFRKCLKDEIEFDLGDGGLYSKCPLAENCIDLNADILKDAIVFAPEFSQIFLVTNIGIPNSNDSTVKSTIAEALQLAIIKRIRVSVFVAAPIHKGNAIYLDPEFTTLKDFAHHTMGIFANPYRPNNYNLYLGADKLSTAINDLGLKLIDTNVVHAGSGKQGTTVFDKILHYNDANDLMITVRTGEATTPPKANVSDTNPSGTFGCLQAYSFTPAKDTKFVLNITAESDYTFEITQIPTSNTAGKSFRTLLAYSQATSTATVDASSPIPLAGIDNLIVGTTIGIDSFRDFDMLSLIEQSGSESFTAEVVTDRTGCQFSRFFGRFRCSDGDSGRFEVSSSARDYMEVVPYTCVGSLLPSEKFQIPRANLIDEDVECVDNNELTDLSDPVVGRTLGVALIARAQVCEPLLINRYSLFDALWDLSLARKHLIGNYMATLFWNESSVKISKDLNGVKNAILNSGMAWNNDTECIPDGVRVEDYLLAMIGKKDVTAGVMNPRSEVFIVTDMPYGKDSVSPQLIVNIHRYKLKLNFLIWARDHSCDEDIAKSMPIYQELAMMSGGVAARFVNYTGILSYIGSGLFGAPTVLQKDYLNSWYSPKPLTTRPFSLIQGHQYAFVTEMSNKGAKVKLLNSTGGSLAILPNDFPSYEMGVFKFDAANYSSGKYAIQIISAAKNDVLQYRLLDLTSTAFHALAFTHDLKTTAEIGAPEFGDEMAAYPVLDIYGDVTTNYTITAFRSVNLTENLELRTLTKLVHRKGCTFNFTMDYMLFCNILNGVDYFEINVESELESFTRTEAITCTGSKTACLHGGTPVTLDDGSNICECPVGWTSDQCQDRVCYNGGTRLYSGMCDCIEGFGGDFCEHVLDPCMRTPQLLNFRKNIGTLLLVVHATDTAAKVVTSQLTDLWYFAQQYVLVTFSDTGVILHISTTNAETFKSAIAEKVKSFDPKPPASPLLLPALKAALDAQLTLKSMMLLIVEEQFLNFTSFDVDDEFSLLMAKNYAEMRIIAASAATPRPNPSASLQYLAAIGNGIPISIPSNGVTSGTYMVYMKKVLPAGSTLTTVVQDRVSTVAYGYMENCTSAGSTVDIVVPSNTEVLLTFFGSVTSADIDDKTISGMAKIVDIASTVLIYDGIPKQSSILTLSLSGEQPCGYVVEVLDTQQIAYGYASQEYFDKGTSTGVLNSIGDNYLVFMSPSFPNSTIRSLYGERVSPKVRMSEIKSEDALVFTLSPSLSRDQCVYSFVVPFNCTNRFFTATISTVGDDNAYFARSFTVFCANLTGQCQHGGTWSARDGCTSCGANYEGADCSLPICKNGGTRDGTVCNCPPLFYGDFCDQWGEGVSTTVPPSTTSPPPGVFRLFTVLNLCAPYDRVFKLTNKIVGEFFKHFTFAADPEEHFYYLSDDKNLSVPIGEWKSSSEVSATLSTIKAIDCTPNLDSVFASILKFVSASLADGSFTGINYFYLIYVTQQGSSLSSTTAWSRLTGEHKFKMMAVGVSKGFKFEQATMGDYFNFSSTAYYETALEDLITFVGRNEQGGTPPAPPNSGHNNPCAWNLQADIYMYIDSATSKANSQDLFDKMKSFAVDFGSGLNVGQEKEQTQVVAGWFAGTSMLPSAPVLTCQQLLSTVTKMALKTKTDVDYSKVLTAVGKYYNNPQFGGRLGGSGVQATSTNLIFLTTLENSADSAAVETVMQTFPDKITNFAVYFNDAGNYAPDSDITKIVQKAESRFVVNATTVNADIVNNLWKTICGYNNLAAGDLLPDTRSIPTYDLVVIRDNSMNTDGIVYNATTDAIRATINQMNSDYQKFAYITVEGATASVWSKDDDTCKTRSAQKFENVTQGTDTNIDFTDAIQYITTAYMLNTGVHLHENMSLRLIFITTTTKTTGAATFKTAMDTLKARNPLIDITIAAIPINGNQLPTEIDAVADCVFYGKTIELQFNVVQSWLKGETANARCKE